MLLKFTFLHCMSNFDKRNKFSSIFLNLSLLKDQLSYRGALFPQDVGIEKAPLKLNRSM